MYRSTVKDSSFVGLIGLSLLWLSCENPFIPDLSKSEDFFKVVHDFEGGPRIIESTPITLTWSEVTIPDFDKFTVSRVALGSVKEVWEERKEITNPLLVTYKDVIDDDQTFQYKVRIEDKNGNFREAKTDPIVLRTTHITVPDEYQSLQKAFDTPFIDNGDTIFVNPGTYTHEFKFLGKHVYITSVAGKEETVIRRGSTVVAMNRGVLNGFTIRIGAVNLFGTALMNDCIVTDVFTIDDIYSGGVIERSAVVVSDTAEVRNCLIAKNSKWRFMGVGGYGGGMIVRDYATVRNTRITRNRSSISGGGILIYGEPTIVNCIIDHNFARRGGGGLFLRSSAEPKVVNSILYRNRSGEGGKYGAVLGGEYSLSMINSIVWGNSMYGSEAKVWQNSSYSNIQSYSGGTGNISSLPLFVDPVSGDFHLQSDSPCIDAGHPGDEYRDVDGSRNDMGAYGGPFGVWNE